MALRSILTIYYRRTIFYPDSNKPKPTNSLIEQLMTDGLSQTRFDHQKEVGDKITDF